MKSANLIKRIYLIAILAFISHYVGTVGMDPSLLDGKNLPTFLFLYVIGDTIRQYKDLWQSLSPKWYGMSFVLYNIAVVIIFSYFSGRIADIIFRRIFFSYCSFGLLLSSILFFLWIGSYSFKSKLVNYIAKSSLAIYMIHCASLIFFNLIGPISLSILNFSGNEMQLFIMVLCLTTAIVTGCIVIDKLLTPIWTLIDKAGGRIQTLCNQKINNFKLYNQ